MKDAQKQPLLNYFVIDDELSTDFVDNSVRGLFLFRDGLTVELDRLKNGQSHVIQQVLPLGVNIASLCLIVYSIDHTLVLRPRKIAYSRRLCAV